MSVITWKDTARPTFGSSALLAKSGTDAMNTAFNNMARSTDYFRDNNIQQFANDKAANTADASNQIMGLDQANFKEGAANIYGNLPANVDKAALNNLIQQRPGQLVQQQSQALGLDALQREAGVAERANEFGNYYSQFTGKDGSIDNKAALETWLKPVSEGGMGGTQEGYRDNKRTFEDNNGITARNAEQALRAANQHDKDLKQIAANARVRSAEIAAAAKLGSDKLKAKAKDVKDKKTASLKSNTNPLVGSGNFLDGTYLAKTKEEEQIDAGTQQVKFQALGADPTITRAIQDLNMDGSSLDIKQSAKDLAFIIQQYTAGISQRETLDTLVRARNNMKPPTKTGVGDLYGIHK